ncbi:hypothetical protein D3C71_1647720 [compost metagenome]
MRKNIFLPGSGIDSSESYGNDLRSGGFHNLRNQRIAAVLACADEQAAAQAFAADMEEILCH